MKVQNAIRMQMILVGLAAALFFTGTVQAQEIYNADFNNAPNSVPFVQPAPVQPSEAATTSMTGSQALQAATSIAAPAQAQQAAIVPSKSAKVWAASALLFCIGLFLFSARTAKKDELDPRESTRARSMPLA